LAGGNVSHSVLLWEISEMDQVLVKATCVFLALSILSTAAVYADNERSDTAKVVAAANVFLSALDEKQRTSVVFPFNDDQQRARWSNFPVRMVPRAGVSMGELTDAQRSAAWALLAAALSQHGYEKVQQIVEGDQVLKTNERNNPMFGKDLYYISMLGTP